MSEPKFSYWLSVEGSCKKKPRYTVIIRSRKEERERVSTIYTRNKRSGSSFMSPMAPADLEPKDSMQPSGALAVHSHASPAASRSVSQWFPNFHASSLKPYDMFKMFKKMFLQ